MIFGAPSMTAAQPGFLQSNARSGLISARRLHSSQSSPACSAMNARTASRYAGRHASQPMEFTSRRVDSTGMPIAA